jgi:tetratricopeptide (TPR) repeat protein
MAASTKRLEFLQKMCGQSPATDDPMPYYALAQEYRSLERHEEALAAFEALRQKDATYVPQYLMCGQMLEQMGRLDAAREWLQAGVAAARAKRDQHALSELETALAALSG